MLVNRNLDRHLVRRTYPSYTIDLANPRAEGGNARKVVSITAGGCVSHRRGCPVVERSISHSCILKTVCFLSCKETYPQV